MHCPRCGQEQPSDSVRYCSRCGFHLSVVGELLLTDGVLTNGVLGNGVVPASETTVSSRRSGVTLGAKLIFAGVVLVPIAILFGFAADTPAFMIAPATAFFLGLVRILYAVAFEESQPAAPVQRSALIPVNPPRRSIPPRASIQSKAITPGASIPPRGSISPRASVQPRASIPPKAAATGEIAPQSPPSVTEQTTHLLDGE